LTHEISPYFLCLWLNERSLTFEASPLEGYGVGGVFHFVWQSAATELPQAPAVYILSGHDKARNETWSWLYRVVPVLGGLCIEWPDGVPRDFLFDTAARYDVEVDINANPSGFFDLLEKSLATLPYYCFCGLGFVEPSARRLFGFQVNSHGKREDLIDSSGNLTSVFRAWIDENFSAL
jgi:hypothetical protein